MTVAARVGGYLTWVQLAIRNIAVVLLDVDAKVIMINMAKLYSRPNGRC